MDVAFAHPIKLIANALGLPPQSMIDRGRAQGVAVAALVGAKEHAVRQVQAGVDIIVAEGAEAGGHCGEVSTLVLVPEVIRALQPIRPVPVLAAGGIVTGRQMAAMMALGAAGAWTGSVWLMTSESEASPLHPGEVRSRNLARHRAFQEPHRQIHASAALGVDGCVERSGQPWPAADAVAAVPQRAGVAARGARSQSRQSQGGRSRQYYVGQGVGLLDQVKTSSAVVREFMEEFAEAASGHEPARRRMTQLTFAGFANTNRSHTRTSARGWVRRADPPRSSLAACDRPHRACSRGSARPCRRAGRPRQRATARSCHARPCSSRSSPGRRLRPRRLGAGHESTCACKRAAVAADELRRSRRIDADRVLRHVSAVRTDQSERPAALAQLLHHRRDRVRRIAVARPAEVRQPARHGQAARILRRQVPIRRRH